MTDLEKALTSKEMMDAYLELNVTNDIIKEIKEYAAIKHEYKPTQRDYFAAMAMQGLCVSMEFATAEDIARESVKQSDALIKALNQPIK